MSETAMMAMFDVGHRLALPNGYWVEKSDEDVWQVGGPLGGRPDVFLAMIIRGSLPVGKGGSMDAAVEQLVAGLNGTTVAGVVSGEVSGEWPGPQSAK